MEEDIFRRPAVGGTLKQSYVEARMHFDHSDEEKAAATHRLQDELARSRGTPYYLTVDPRTRAVLGKFEGADIPPIGNGDRFHEFLRRALD
jgi:hypothetical protein